MSRSVFDFYPWQKELAQQWLSHRERFSHAWLLHGIAGIGKFEFAQAAAASLLCEAPINGLACRQCASCHLLSLGHHPDLRYLIPEYRAIEKGIYQEESSKAPSKQITVEQIRSLGEFFTVSTHRGGNRVLVLYLAEDLNTTSSNALLKILEEPPEQTIFLLVTDALQRVLPTIISRCRRFPIPIPDHQESIHWLMATLQMPQEPLERYLAASSGAPLTALTYAQSEFEPVAYWLMDFCATLSQGVFPDMSICLDKLEKINTDQWIETLQRWLFDLSLVQRGLSAHYYPALPLAHLSAQVLPHKLSDLQQWLNEQRRLSRLPLNVSVKNFILSILQRVALLFVKV